MDSQRRLAKFAEGNKHVQDSLMIIEDAIKTYRAENTCISFNGGKDCTAVLHLVHSVTKKLSLNNNDAPKLTAFYAPLPNHFKEEADFVQKVKDIYNLNLMQYSSNTLKESLIKFKSDAPHIRAVFIGSRKDDFKPGAKVTAMAPSDNDWPQFMRINPILDWSYHQVWDFLRELDIPYCDLYDRGYSSLGTRDNTSKNPSLLRYKSNGEPYYLPAWNLTRIHEERLSRTSSIAHSDT